MSTAAPVEATDAGQADRQTTGAAGPGDPGDRGELTIADRVVERVAGYAATQVPGASAAPRRVLGIDLGDARPDSEAVVQARVDGRTATVAATLAVEWPRPVREVARQFREHVRADERDGLTVVHAGAPTDAVEDEATALRGASAHLRDSRGRRLSLTVDLSDHADIAEVRDTLEGRVVSHARQAVDDPDLPVDIELRPDRVRAAGRDLL